MFILGIRHVHGRVGLIYVLEVNVCVKTLLTGFKSLWFELRIEIWGAVE